MFKLNRYTRMNLRNALAGNTLAEYVLPVALVVVSSGAILAFLAANNALPNYLASASGGSVSGGGAGGGTIQSPSMGFGVGGSLGTGGQGGAGSNATIIGGGGPGFFFSGPAYNGAGAETVGGEGTGNGLKMPTPPANHRQGGSLPPGDNLHYVPTVQGSIATGQTMAQSRAAAEALVGAKYADSMRVQVAATEDPRGVAQAGGEDAFEYGNEAREQQINAATEGGNYSQQLISSGVQQEAESIQGEASEAVQQWAESQELMAQYCASCNYANNNDQNGYGTLNPDGYQAWVEQMTATLNAELQTRCVTAGLPCNED